MRRQKVKGTGHKQPADANTEPNFYAMPPLSMSYDVSELAPFSPPRQARQIMETTIHSSPSLHGAAHLLRGFAGGSPAKLPQIPLLGATGATTAQDPNLLQQHGHFGRHSDSNTETASTKRNVPTF